LRECVRRLGARKLGRAVDTVHEDVRRRTHVGLTQHDREAVVESHETFHDRDRADGDQTVAVRIEATRLDVRHDDASRRERCIAVVVSEKTREEAHLP
jgi:hypothetical protein